ncbi:MAG TPA: Ni/Fe-hydrogenase cytochrome b subunit [Polyangia bacterium]|jgi:Ni/Fe-hydrogenase subunit HybB-like protein
MKRLLAVKAVLWFLVGGAAALAAVRFVRGLGATTALTDLTPWGFWIGFDVMGGVALAAGGFVVAATVYVFHLERYHAIVRPAVLTAFLGYVAVVVGLLADLGLPWNIWHMIVYWNPHSPLFEVGWCVMLYTTVLSLELAPVLFEAAKHPLLAKVYRALKRATIPLVILGIMFSTLHQSSLGSLFLIMPHRLHPLWYTPVLPILFFVSAVGLGLMMVTAESLTSAWLYEQEPERAQLQGLGKAGAWVLGAYAVLRLGDVLVRGQGAALVAGTFASWLFIVELLLAAIIPALLLALPAVRRSTRGLGVAAFTGVTGFVMTRIDVGGLAMVSTTGTGYVPSWMEVWLSLGIVAAAALAYFFVAERFHLFHAGPVDRARFRHRLPGFDPATLVARPDPHAGGITRYSLMTVLGAGAVLALLPQPSAFAGVPIPARPVTPPGFGARLVLDGDRAGEAVVFDHQRHVEREGAGTCARCHHLLKPGEQATGCARCHRDMQRATAIFDHRLHAARLGPGRGCATCHVDDRKPKDVAHTRACLDCHTRMVAAGATIQPRQPPRLAPAPGYVAAMHGLCIGCHEQRARDPRVAKPALGQCATCHAGKVAPYDPRRPDERLR